MLVRGDAELARDVQARALVRDGVSAAWHAGAGGERRSDDSEARRRRRGGLAQSLQCTAQLAAQVTHDNEARRPYRAGACRERWCAVLDELGGKFF